MIFTIRSGITILADHPRLYLPRHSTPGKDWFRIQKPIPTDPLCTAKQDSITLPDGVGLPGRRHSIGLARRWHLGIDTLWLLNGLIFTVLIFAIGQWMRLVPMSWNVSGTFDTVPLDQFSIQIARTLHFLVLCWFVMFIVVHVALVMTTGALRNLNHIYVSRDDASWVGFAIFAVSMVVMIVAWVASTPLTYRFLRKVQKAGYALIGPAQKLFEHIDAKPGQYSEKDISPYFWHNGKYPETEEYKQLQAGDFAGYTLRINGLVENPVDLNLEQLRSFPTTSNSRSICAFKAGRASRSR
ncbi:hypothetical protein [Rhodoglobus vestalii]|uniref:hypothetical protein n=1 Tax=Rhodoglobus vestalii TaxID=193384 RepID=UPI001C00A315|nr:hypothetical protein [Rhodoglobus vestalii]